MEAVQNEVAKQMIVQIHSQETIRSRRRLVNFETQIKVLRSGRVRRAARWTGYISLLIWLLPFLSSAEVGHGIEVRPIRPIPFDDGPIERPGARVPELQSDPHRVEQPRARPRRDDAGLPCEGAQGQSDHAQMCAIVNQYRVSQGLSELRVDAEMSRVAYHYACDMARRGFFGHTSPEGFSPFDRMRAQGIRFSAAAENLAMGYRTHELAFQGWLDSSGHRRNLDQPVYRRQGLGFCRGHWVHLFAN